MSSSSSSSSSRMLRIGQVVIVVVVVVKIVDLSSSCKNVMIGWIRIIVLKMLRTEWIVFFFYKDAIFVGMLSSHRHSTS